jgi:hypothetical protein
MPDRAGRRFKVLDAMILVAATAIGLALTQRLSPGTLTLSYDPIGPMSARWGSPWTARDWALWAVKTSLNRYHYFLPLVATLTLTVLSLRMAPPRPRRARLFRQPGVVACLAAVCGLGLWVPLPAILAMRATRREDPPLALFAIAAASAVGASWLILWMGRRWRAEAGWIDRAGRALGVVWLVRIPLGLLLGFF